MAWESDDQSFQGEFMMETQQNPCPGDDGIDRRGMLKCMAWVGTGLVWALNGGIPAARVFGRDPQPAGVNDFSFPDQ
jgi:hypothetical protein